MSAAAKAAWTAFALGAVLILAFHLTQSPQGASQRVDAGAQVSRTAAPEEQDQDQGQEQTAGGPGTADTGGGVADSPAGVDRGNGFAQASPDADQAPVQPDLVQYERQDIIMPEAPAPDTQDPLAVADAFLTVYNSRASETDTSWQQGTQAWVVPDLASQLPGLGNGALEGKTPAAVRTVDVGENVAEWGIDTPLRWAHHVEVLVDTQDQGSFLLEYRVRAQLTEQGWLINAAPLDSWQRVN